MIVFFPFSFPLTPATSSICERVTPRLSHANSAVVLSAVKVLMKFMEMLSKDLDYYGTLLKKLAPPLVTLLSAEPELQYVALRNINLIVQKRWVPWHGGRDRGLGRDRGQGLAWAFRLPSGCGFKPSDHGSVRALCGGFFFSYLKSEGQAQRIRGDKGYWGGGAKDGKGKS